MFKTLPDEELIELYERLRENDESTPEQRAEFSSVLNEMWERGLFGIPDMEIVLNTDNDLPF